MDTYENWRRVSQRQLGINSTFEEPKMIIVSSSERLKVAALLTKEDSTTESASIDFCESQIKDHSVMEVTTYSGELRQVFPNIFSINKVSSKVTKTMMYLVVVYDFHLSTPWLLPRLAAAPTPVSAGS